MNAVEMKGVWKKFNRGEQVNALRDFIPGFVKGLFTLTKEKGDELRGREFWALKDVNFEVKKGEALGIIGFNGAGKSTILKLLSRILRPTKGELNINGRLTALIEVGAGFHEDLTGRENIYLNGTILGMKKKEIDRKFDSIVSFSELEDFIDTPVKRYSSGMYLRLGFSVAVHLDPDILLMDEILSVGDFRFQKKCIEKMQEFVKNNVTVIYVSHNLPSVIDLCPKALLLNKGMVREMGESRKIVHDYYRTWGTSHLLNQKELRKEKIELLNSKREPCYSFRAGETATLRAEFFTEKELHDIAVAFTVKREDGVIIFDAHSEMFEGKKYHLRANEKNSIDIEFDVALPEGAYYAGMYLQQGTNLYYYEDEICQFRVFAPRLSGPSLVFLSPKWK